VPVDFAHLVAECDELHRVARRELVVLIVVGYGVVDRFERGRRQIAVEVAARRAAADDAESPSSEITRNAPASNLPSNIRVVRS